MPISKSSFLGLFSTALGAIPIGFGINCLLRPAHALTFFELSMPHAAADKNLVEALIAVYGVRDIFMGVALWAALYCRARKAAGLILLATASVAFADGYICKVFVGTGEWNHWGYAPMLVLVSSVLMGGLDSIL